jgi:hypothetical protein
MHAHNYSRYSKSFGPFPCRVTYINSFGSQRGLASCSSGSQSTVLVHEDINLTRAAPAFEFLELDSESTPMIHPLPRPLAVMHQWAKEGMPSHTLFSKSTYLAGFKSLMQRTI